MRRILMRLSIAAALAAALAFGGFSADSTPQAVATGCGPGSCSGGGGGG